MKNKFKDFLALHRQAEPLLIGNVWDVPSAKTFEKQKFKAIGTSSAAVAETLGYGDGQEMPLETYMLIVGRIAASVSIPFSVDLEYGYGDTPEQIAGHIARLYAIGVSGINIEDSIVTDGKRTILPPAIFAEKLRQIIGHLKAGAIEMFINLRSDPFLLGLPNALEDALSRIEIYNPTGVHGLFLPCITRLADMEKVTRASTLPVNVMCMPDLPDFAQLLDAGVKRISMGPFLYKKMDQRLERSVEKIVKEGSFESLF